MGFIYKITNLINGKCYIGQTRNTIARRYWFHKRDSKTSKCALYCAMRKYGLNNFVVSELEECQNNLLNEREMFWIKHFNSNNKRYGYNETIGGKAHSSKHKKPIDMYDVNGNFIRSFESITGASIELGINQNQISSCCSKHLKHTHDYIFVYKGEKPIITKPYRTKVYQYDFDGNFIREFNSIREASKFMNGGKKDHLTLSNCLCGKFSQAYGYQWKNYKVDKIDPYKKPKVDYRRPKKQVFVYDKFGSFIETIDSLMECAKKYKTEGITISKCCRKEPKYKSSKGYQYSFEKVDMMPCLVRG